MSDGKKTFRIDQRPWDFDCGLFIMIEDGRGGRSFVESYSVRKAGPETDGFATPCAMRISKIEMQQLMDELWHAGIRPSEGSGSAGQLAATQAHLKDMQKLVFEVLKP